MKNKQKKITSKKDDLLRDDRWQGDGIGVSSEPGTNKTQAIRGDLAAEWGAEP